MYNLWSTAGCELMHLRDSEGPSYRCPGDNAPELHEDMAYMTTCNTLCLGAKSAVMPRQRAGGICEGKASPCRHCNTLRVTGVGEACFMGMQN